MTLLQIKQTKEKTERKPRKKEKIIIIHTEWHVKKGRVFGSEIKESKAVQYYLEEKCEFQYQLKESQELLLKLFKTEAPDLYEKYAEKDWDYRVRFTFPCSTYDPKWINKDPYTPDSWFPQSREFDYALVQRSNLLDELKKHRVEYARFQKYQELYDWQLKEREEEPHLASRYDPVCDWIREDLAKLGLTPEEFFDYPLAGHTWGKENKAIAAWNKKKGIVEKKPEPKLTRAELLKKDQEFLAKFDQERQAQPEEKAVSPAVKQAQDKFYEKLKDSTSKGTLEEELLNMPKKLRSRFCELINSGNAISATLFTEDVLNWFTKEIIKRKEEDDFLKEETTENNKEDQPTPSEEYLVAEYKLQYASEQEAEPVPQRTSEETFFTDCVVVHSDYVPENYFDDEEDEEFDYSSLSDEYVSQCVNGANQSTFDEDELIAEYANQYIPEDEDEDFSDERSSQNLHESYQVPRSMAYGHEKPAKIPLNPFILNNNSTKMGLLKHEIPKIPIESASSRPKHPKTVPKPLKLSRKRSKSPPDRNPLDRYLYLRKDSLASSDDIKRFKKEKHKSSLKRRREYADEKYFRIPLLC